MKYWKSSLCNIELPDDEYADLRKERHMEFHVDEQAHRITKKVAIQSLSNNNSQLLEELINKEVEEQYG